MQTDFILSRTTRVTAQWASEPVRRAVERFRRDMEMTLSWVDFTAANKLMICLSPALAPEQYTIDIQDRSNLVVCAGDDLGAVYALLYISRTWLGVNPFWFWNDQRFEPQPLVTIEEPHTASTPAPVALRGWSLDSAAFLAGWANEENAGWEMVFEALLRCGGNVIRLPDGAPAGMAAAMGLWLMQDPDAPLGLAPAPHAPWPQAGAALRQRWYDAVEAQKDTRRLWVLGYPGQNGAPFWEEDPACQTLPQRGRRLSDILWAQYDLVRAAAPRAPVCTPLTADAAALYRAGVLDLPDDLVLIWPDDGHARLPRTPRGAPGAHGLHLHLCGHDHRAANRVTMLPAGAEGAGAELRRAYLDGVDGLWLLEAGDVRPHLYPLDLAAALWADPDADMPAHRLAYLRDTFRAPDGWALDEGPLDDLNVCLRSWGDATAVYGLGRRAGEELMTAGTRAFACAWLCGRTKSSVPAMRWLAGDRPFGEQLTRYRNACVDALPRFETLLPGCEYAARATTPLWGDTFVLQVRVYLYCLRGAVRFCDACALFFKEDYKACFTLLGRAADDYAAAAAALQASGTGRWAGFYGDVALSDCYGAADLLHTLMAVPRAAGDGPYYEDWQREALGETRAKKIADLPLYRAMAAAEGKAEGKEAAPQDGEG